MPLALFDLDGTLVDQAKAARLWVDELVANGVIRDVHVERVAEALKARLSKGPVFAHLVAELDLSVSAEDLWMAYRMRMPQLVRCAQEDLAALVQLRAAGWTIGIVSNGDSGNQVGKIHATGLAPLVDGWAVSSEVGFRKPEPGIFHAIAARLGQALSGWMVGDGQVADIGGGAAVGLRTILIGEEEAPRDSAVRPYATAPNVAKAAEIILSAGFR